MSSYLSDADTLLAFRNYEATNVVQSAAASVAARGVLFGNSHPLSSRYDYILRLFIIAVAEFSIFIYSSDHSGGMLFAGQRSGRLSNH